MRDLGELSLLLAFVAAGFAAFGCVAGASANRPGWLRWGRGAAVTSVAALTVVMAILARALLTKDFTYAYVAQYSSRLLPWHYSLSALWVGQAGSLLLWAWFSGVLALGFWFVTRRRSRDLAAAAFGVQLGYLCFLLAIMVFAADPMEASLSAPGEGAGLSPLLQHPAMLIHPPVVFLGYALWAIPFGLAAVALVSGRLDRDWVRLARPWALAAWCVLGLGILWGARWAYEELGWGGYWNWDPVENGSLIPWLTGTALIHAMMSWQYRQTLKKTALALALATFGLCNFATFLTRSGIFSSLHAFSASPIGWLFLGLMIVLGIGGAAGLTARRGQLRPQQPLASLLSREAFVSIAIVALGLLTSVTIAGTLSTVISSVITGKMVMVGPAFYNSVLIPTGLVLVATTALAPLLRWGAPPSDRQRRALRWCLGLGVLACVATWLAGVRHPLGLVIAGLVGLAPAALVRSLVLDARRCGGSPWRGLGLAIRSGRRQYAGFLIHLGFVALVVGVAGSSLGTRQQDLDMRVGQVVPWAGCDVQLVAIRQRSEPDKLIGEAELELSRGGRTIGVVRPAQHFHLLQQAWTTEVAIHATWRGDVYVILHGGDEGEQVRMTLVENPLMRWLWLSGGIIGLGTLWRLWPVRRRQTAAAIIPLPEMRRRNASRSEAA